MTEAERKLAISIGICTQCVLKRQKYLPPRKTFRSAFRRNLRRSLETLGEWVTPHINCNFRIPKCPADWKGFLLLSDIRPQKWIGSYAAWGKGKSAGTGRVIDKRADGYLIAEWEIPTHKSGKNYGHFFLNGNIRLIKRNIKVYTSWAPARSDYFKRQRS